MGDACQMDFRPRPAGERSARVQRERRVSSDGRCDEPS